MKKLLTCLAIITLFAFIQPPTLLSSSFDVSSILTIESISTTNAKVFATGEYYKLIEGTDGDATRTTVMAQTTNDGTNNIPPLPTEKSYITSTGIFESSSIGETPGPGYGEIWAWAQYEFWLGYEIINSEAPALVTIDWRIDLEASENSLYIPGVDDSYAWANGTLLDYQSGIAYHHVLEAGTHTLEGTIELQTTPKVVDDGWKLANATVWTKANAGHWPTAVIPEPSTALLLAFGLLGLARGGRRKR